MSFVQLLSFKDSGENLLPYYRVKVLFGSHILYFLKKFSFGTTFVPRQVGLGLAFPSIIISWKRFCWDIHTGPVHSDNDRLSHAKLTSERTHQWIQFNICIVFYTNFIAWNFSIQKSEVFFCVFYSFPLNTSKRHTHTTVPFATVQWRPPIPCGLRATRNVWREYKENSWQHIDLNLIIWNYLSTSPHTI